MPPILIFFICHWYFSLFTLSFVQHRYASHAVFSMNKFWERFFYLMAYIAQGSAYVSPRTFAIMHRMHHAFTDTEKDPHSPHHHRNLFTLMWYTRAFSTSIFRGKFIPEEKFTKNLPDWRALDLWGHSTVSRLMWVGIYFAIYYFLAQSPWWYLLIPFHALNVPFHAVIINWFAHKYGVAHFKVKNHSRNLWPFDIIMLGEAYHNNHHKNPSSVNFGKRWYQIDPIYPLILVFNWAGIVRINRQQHHHDT